MTKFQRQRRFLLRTIVVLSLTLTTLCFYVYAKYIKTEELKGSITISAEIGKIHVYEHSAVRQDDGSYILDQNTVIQENDEAYGNSYILIPGLDVPKDPYVVVDKENDIPVYVFLEIEDKLPEAITYVLDSYWIKLDGYNNVYVYSDPASRNAVVVTKSIDKIGILWNDTVDISQKLNSYDTTGLELKFTAYMYQTAAGDTPAEVFTHYNSQN